ncbi:MAG: carboxylesterase family protein [Acutalibacteraceae bacterium]
MNYIEKDTPCGKIKGIENENCYEFRGIRYARAGRFEYPKQEKEWSGVYDATEFKACCFQHRAFDDDSVVNPFYHKEFRKGLSFTYSEDCLFLNIFAPKNADKTPVLIFIHGGSFTGGSSDEGHIRGNRLGTEVVTVTINYRLGPFGFCAHPELTDENGVCGNFGLYDQTAAIQWVIDNISAFGGDPNKITLMGQSAGAMSVDIHLNNPMLKGRISGAIMLSGAGLQRCLLKPLTVEKIKPFWDKIMQNAGVSSMNELKQIGAKELYYSWLKACKESKFSMPYTFPVYDGYLLTKESFNIKTLPDIPQILGATCTDMIPIVLECVTKKWANYAEKHNSKPCYVFNFNRWLPGDDMGAWHAADLLYAFSTLDFNWRPFEEIDYRISEQLVGAICAFVKNGDPNNRAIPEWRPGGKEPMSFCERSACEKWKTKDNIKFTFNGKGKTV